MIGGGFKIALVFLFLASCAFGDEFIYSSGVRDGRAQGGKEGEAAVKVKIGEAFPEVILPGQHAGLYLGNREDEHLLLEIAFVRPSEGKSENLVRIRCNSGRLSDFHLEAPYVVRRILIPAQFREDEENILEIVNSGKAPVGVDFIRVSRFDFKAFPKLALALESPEKSPKCVRKYFHHSWDSDEEIKTVGYFNLSTGMFDREISETLKKAAQKGGAAHSNTVVLDCHVSERESFDKKNAFSLMSTLLDAPANGCYEVLLRNQKVSGNDLFTDKYGGAKAPFHVLPHIASLYSENAQFLPCLVTSPSDDFVRPFLHYCASIDGDVITFAAIGRYKENLKLVLPVPWKGKTVIERLDSAIPDGKDVKFQESTVEISSAGNLNRGAVELELPPSEFHFVRIRKEGAALPQLVKDDSFPEPAREKMIRMMVKPDSRDIFAAENTSVLTKARTTKGVAEAFGELKDKMKIEAPPAQTSTIGILRNIVPEEKDGFTINFPPVLQAPKGRTGVLLAVRSVSMPKELKGLGFWIYRHSADARKELLEFEYGNRIFSCSSGANTWEYCFLPAEKAGSSYLRVICPASKTGMKLEFNGFNWISNATSEGEKNSVKKCAVNVNSKKSELEVMIEGESAGYCEIHRRIGLDFVPDGMKVFDMNSKEVETDFKAVYNKASSLLSIKGHFPANKGLKQSILKIVVFKNTDKKQ